MSAASSRQTLIQQQKLRQPAGFGLYVLLVVLTLLSVPSRWPSLGALRPTLVLTVLIAVVVCARQFMVVQFDRSATTRYVNLLLLYILLTVPLVQWPGSVVRTGIEGFAKAAVFFYFTVYLIDGIRRLQILLGVFLVCQLFRVFEPLYLHVTGGYWGSRAHMSDGEFMARLSGAPSDIINPNGLAFVIVGCLPYLHYLLGESRKSSLRIAYVVLVLPLLYAFSLTGSRSGLVGLIVVAGMIVGRAKRRVLIGMGVIAVGAVVVATMSGDMVERYKSLAESGTRHAETRDGRINAWGEELATAMERPLFGHGIGTSAEAKFHDLRGAQIAHNLYLEALIELGTIGFALYLCVLGSVVCNLRRVLNRADYVAAEDQKLSPGEATSVGNYCNRAAAATYVWVVMCLIFSMASYGLSEFYWYFMAGVSVTLVRLTDEQERSDRTSSQMRPKAALFRAA